MANLLWCHCEYQKWIIFQKKVFLYTPKNKEIADTGHLCLIVGIEKNFRLNSI